MVTVMKIGDGAEYTIKGGDVGHYDKDNFNHNFTFRPLFPWCLTTFTDPQIVRHREHLVGSPLASKITTVITTIIAIVITTIIIIVTIIYIFSIDDNLLLMISESIKSGGEGDSPASKRRRLSVSGHEVTIKMIFLLNIMMVTMMVWN